MEEVAAVGASMDTEEAMVGARVMMSLTMVVKVGVVEGAVAVAKEGALVAMALDMATGLARTGHCSSSWRSRTTRRAR